MREIFDTVVGTLADPKPVWDKIYEVICFRPGLQANIKSRFHNLDQIVRKQINKLQQTL